MTLAGDAADGAPNQVRSVRGWIGTRAAALSVAVLAALAYLPSLGSSPGRMPADTKLSLYLEPAELLGRASSTLEREQFGGWVPHQQITYLWPSGPWYRLFDLAGVPDWIAHRLWIGTILFCAGAGVLWLGRRLGLTVGTALVAALVYQLSPYLLPYVSRTSLLLLPWAALGWLVGLTVLACSDERATADGTGGPRWQRWRSPALIALIVATVGSVNATALALVAPAPLLWLLHAAWMTDIRWRQAFGIAARTVVLCLAVSLWWIAMLVVQSRYGAPVLAYSETLEDVSRNATASEVLRGLGYWLFYIRDPVAPTTTASEPYLVSTGAIAVSYAVTLAGLAGLTITRWAPRRFAALLVLVGLVLAVGVHPLDSPSPLMSLFANDDDSGIALALRSSTRAAPLLVLGIALGSAALVGALPARRARGRSGRSTGSWSPRAVAGTVVVAVALLNLQSLWGLELVDPAIDRDQDPPTAWIEAADSLGEGSDYRVLQLPGAEFGAFRWGYTVDQPLVALTERPLVTRDLLPLGAGAAMNLLYAIDDRAQEGTLEAGSIAPVARLLGADTIWSANDLQFERFRTPRPETFDSLLATASADGALGEISYFGVPEVNVPDVAMLDPAALALPGVGRAVAPVGLVEIDQPIAVVRAKPSSVLLSGDGDGIVDAAAAGLIIGVEAIRYSASLAGDELGEAADDALIVIITDTNRDRAHHWRSSQDVHGHTEPGGPATDVLTPTSADQRLDVFADDDPARQTVAIQEGPVVATASSYGEPFAYRPEDRAVMAVDGDPTTAWLVADHGDPVGEHIALGVDAAVTSLSLRQPVPDQGGRRITRVAISVDGVGAGDFELTEQSVTAAGQVLPIATDGPATITVEIAAVDEGSPALAAARSGVGFVEVDAGLGATTEWIRPPVDAVDDAVDRPLAIVLTRLRVGPLDPWRSDPEPELQRIVELPDDRMLEPGVTLRLDARADDETLAAALAPGREVAIASSHLTGSPRHAGMFAADGDPTTAWITPFDGAIGSSLTVPSAAAIAGSFDLIQPAGPYSVVTVLEIVDGERPVTVEVPVPDADGRSTVRLPRALRGDEVTMRIAAVEPLTTVDRRYGDVVTAPAAIAEVEAPGIATATFDPARVVAADCRTDLLTVDGASVGLTYETTAGALLDGTAIEATTCESPIALPAGEHRIRSDSRYEGYVVDRVVLSEPGAPPAAASPVPVEPERDDTRDRRVAVDPCPTGCWVVLGEGYNDAWEATADGTDLGPVQLIDGGFNGWWLPPTDTSTTVEFRWTAQRPVTFGLFASVAAAGMCLLIVAITRRRGPAPLHMPQLAPIDPRSPAASFGWRSGPRAIAGQAWLVPLVLLLCGGLLIQPVWGIVGGVVGLAALLLARPIPLSAGYLLGCIGVGLASFVALAVVWVERRDQPLPNAGWTASFDQLGGVAVFAVLCVAVGAMATPRPTDRVRSSCAR